MTFFIPRTNVIESDEGFSVEVLGPTGLRYAEGGCVLHLDSEMLVGPALLILYSRNMTIESPGNGPAGLNQEEKERVVENVRAAFRFRGFEIEVV